ncbi:hypothetical protein [Microbacterium sp. NPDC087868]|uniref:hypothetical protein n=1 Tax=Microbacterium sp. NPDC087868 TaxID=3364195 RepID=UPI00385003D0
MTDPTQNPYVPPPAPGAGIPPVPPATSVPPVPPAPTASPLGYQPPPAPHTAPPVAPQYAPPVAPQYATPPQPVQPPQQVAPYGYPGQAPVPAGRKQTSPQTSSIISVVAGAVSIIVLPWIAGFIGIGMGVFTLRTQSTARRQGLPTSGAHTTMAIIGIVLGSIGILAKLALDYFL